MEQEKENIPVSPVVGKEEGMTAGPVIVIVVIVVLIALGGFYLWRNADKNKTPEPATAEPTTIDEAAGIEVELNSIDIGSSPELDQIDSQLQ